MTGEWNEGFTGCIGSMFGKKGDDMVNRGPFLTGGQRADAAFVNFADF